MLTNIARSECGRVHGPNWLKWAGHLAGKDQVIGLELGTFKGDSAEWFLDNIFTSPHSVYHCVDMFQGSVEHKQAGIDCTSNETITREKLARFGDKVKIHVGYSAAVMTNELAISEYPFLDFVYVDAAHDAMNVLRDAVLAFQLLKPNGVMVFDDYNWRVMPRPIDCPKMAVDAFISCYGDHLTVLGVTSQYAIQKKA